MPRRHLSTPPRLGRPLAMASARKLRYHRMLRVARTLADIDNADKIGRLHLAEALSYRALAEDVRQPA